MQLEMVRMQALLDRTILIPHFLLTSGGVKLPNLHLESHLGRPVSGVPILASSFSALGGLTSTRIRHDWRFCEQGGADNRQLHMPEYQRLNLGLSFFAVATLGVSAFHWEMLRPAAALTAAAVAGITAAVPAFYYSQTSRHGLHPGPIAEVIL